MLKLARKCLMTSHYHKHHCSVVNEVISHSIIIQAKATPLHCAAIEGHTACVALLVANGADASMKNVVS